MTGLGNLFPMTSIFLWPPVAVSVGKPRRHIFSGTSTGLAAIDDYGTEHLHYEDFDVAGREAAWDAGCISEPDAGPHSGVRKRVELFLLD
jgi:hypothetical protein